MPGLNTSCPSGTSTVTFTVPLSGSTTGLIIFTAPLKDRSGTASAVICAPWPTRMFRISFSGTRILATSGSKSATAKSDWLAVTVFPNSTVRAVTTPSIGETISVYSRVSRAASYCAFVRSTCALAASYCSELVRFRSCIFSSRSKVRFASS
ncbi:MAG: hypothetical protein A3F84_02935 [Candidatus Handelsmanbacteria bacterium RIFCSPLOWO2_12_FULL_64_10]|uniref:Uncharacterized protein n=1 Tax=Handelsmanbacteria sp. (strain RIFCSPLOWO2_12_FULL_64_10) TaxID=1817868 RepID=A0A1F6CBM0_HANXR|nr:MAG: hypothetical protein A3F84_02935 [Candidatus Handelsmanbacteria bacterium RIFCSPLOWO2_12_FULL_64_10]